MTTNLTTTKQTEPMCKYKQCEIRVKTLACISSSAEQFVDFERVQNGKSGNYDVYKSIWFYYSMSMWTSTNQIRRTK